MKKLYQLIGFAVFFFWSGQVQGQDIDLENIGSRMKKTLKKNPFKISGALSAHTIFYHSNSNNSRNPFIYFLNGTLNLGIYNWNLPVSYSFTNQGTLLNYQVPWKFNRISLHPKYKWIQTHIGDINMVFSPYTYNGLIFTGAGLELNPKIPFKIALIGGRFNKAVSDDGNPQTIPAFRRMGYGAQLKWEKEKYKITLIGFYAKDNIRSINSIPEAKGVLPQENLVLSVKASVSVHRNIEIHAELANSAITNDIRAHRLPKKSKNIAALFIRENTSTETYNAYNGGINLNLKNTSIGIQYERIDPDYRTLGAYFFNNDLENITLNNSLNLFKGRLSLATNIGRQIDNLNQYKLKSTSRWVGAANAGLKVSEKLMIVGSYSNFIMFTNRQLNQFANINQNPLLVQQPQDSVDFRQISQNTNININYIISNKKERTQTISVNYSLNDMVNKENDLVRKGGLSRFHNAALTYALGFPNKKINIAVSTNYTHIYSASRTSVIWGPALSVNTSFLADKLQASFGASYNQSVSAVSQVAATNIRLGANYTPWKKHNFNASIIQIFRTNNRDNKPIFNELTATLGYGYSF